MEVHSCVKGSTLINLNRFMCQYYNIQCSYNHEKDSFEQNKYLYSEVHLSLNTNTLRLFCRSAYKKCHINRFVVIIPSCSI